MTLEGTDIERRLRANRDAFVLKEHVSGKSEAWKHFCVLLVTWVQSLDSVHHAVHKAFFAHHG